MGGDRVRSTRVGGGRVPTGSVPENPQPPQAGSEAASDARTPYRIPGTERYFLDADGFCWREVEIEGEIWHSMARVNPDNSATPRPLLYLTPVTEQHHTLRAYRLALLDAAAIFAQTAEKYEGNAVGRFAYSEGARVLRQWAADPGRMVGPLHRHRADEIKQGESDA